MKNKNSRLYTKVLLSILGLLCAIHSVKAQVPIITSFTPTSGAVGTTVTITGTNFNATPANNKVYFGAVAVTPTAGSATSLSVTVPAGATSVTPITVQNTATGLQASSMTTVTGTTTRQFTVTNTPIFTPNYAKTDFAMGAGTTSVTIGDFNGDGRSDLATTNAGNNNVSIRLGDGMGGFSGTTEVPVGTAPISVAIGDFNGDGKADFATANNGNTNSVSIRLGDGMGGFTGTTEVSVSTIPESIAIGDFNGDGISDFATVSFFNNDVSIRLGDGMGGFSGTTTVAVGNGPQSIAIGDFNGDGKADFATANTGNNNVSIRLGDGMGGFSGTTTVAVGNTPRSVAIGDFNGDGKADFATANGGSNNVTIRLGDGLGGFSGTTTVTVGTNPYSVAIGDFNGDGRADFATSNASNDISIRLGDGMGDFSGTTTVTVGTNPYSVAIGDFNGDGKADLATANQGSNNVSVLLYTPSPVVPTITSFSPTSGTVGTTVTITGTNFNATPANNKVYFGAVATTPTAGSATSLTVTVPVGATSVTPITVQNTATGLQASSTASSTSLFTVTNNPPITPVYSARNFPIGISPSYVASGDFNKDGIPDLAVTDYATASNKVNVLLGIGDGTFGTATAFAVGSNPNFVNVGDFNGDGNVDLVVSNENSNNVSILLGIGNGSFSATTNFAAGPQPFVTAIGDFNGDGKQDIAVANVTAGNVTVLLGTGTGSFGMTTNLTVGSFPHSVAIGDFNGDGKSDLAVGNYANGNVGILLGTGTGSFGAMTNFAVGSAPISIRIGDFNGDGKQDLATANTGSANVSILLGTGTGTFGTATNFAVGLSPFNLSIGDMNGDGKQDLIVPNRTSNNVSVLLGSGTGSFGAATNIAVGTNPQSVAVGDFNGDGVADIMSSNYSSSSITLLSNLPPTLTALTPLTIDEDAPQQVVNLAGITDGGEGNQTITVTATSDNLALLANPTITYTSPNTTGTLRFTPLPNANGTATITVSVNDGVSTTSKTFVVTVNAINDVPVFTKGSNPSVQINAGNQVFNNWATGVSDGDPEVVQNLTFELTNDNNALFSIQPAISPTGDLTFTPATGQTGTANLTVKLRDDGNNTAPNVNESAVQNFTISVVNTNNQAPAFTKGADPTVLEDAGAQTVLTWATGIDDGDPALNQQVTFEIVNNTNPALFSVQPAISETGTLTYTPAPNANGTAQLILRLRDNGSGVAPNVNVSANQTFNITITAVNDAPTFTKGDDISVLNSQAQSFGAWATNIDDGDPEIVQTLTFELSNDNNGLFSVPPTINPNGTLTFTPAPNANGVANVTVILRDNGSNTAPNVNESLAQTFKIIISNGVNDAPTFDLGTDITLNENEGQQIRANFATNIDDGDPEITQVLTFQVSNNNNNLFLEQPTIDVNGTLRFATRPNANGTAEVSVVLVDNGSGASPNVNRSVIKKFNINVTPVNVAPSFLINREGVLGQNFYNTGGTQFFFFNYWYVAPLEILNYNTDGLVNRDNFAFNLDDSDPEIVQILTFNVSNDNNALFDVQPNIDANGKLTYTVKAGALGTANVTVTLSDNGSNVLPNRNTSASQTFIITIRGKNFVYIDANDNGTFDAGESPRPNTLVQINNFTCVYTNAKGEYDVYANGNYNVKVVLPTNFTSSNPANYTGNETGWLSNKNFGLVGTPTKDVSVNVYNWFARPGFDTYYWINFQNKGDTPQSGNINFTFDERLQYVETQYANAPIFVRGNQLTYRYTNLLPGEWRWFAIRLKIPVREDFILGQTVIYANAKINMNQGEAIVRDDFPENNAFNHCIVVRNSYDPNDKQSNPAGNISPEFVADREFLTYTVRFQNEGTAEAIRVEVRDTLSNLLDLSTLEVLGSSHAFNFFLTGNQAVWHFENINLPAKRDDEAGSIGFFQFRIKPKTTVVVGNEIENRSGIYFDFNPPIITNTVKTKVVQDMEAPKIVSLSPENNTKDVPTTKQLFFSFDEKVKKGQGEIWLLEDGKVSQKIDVNSSKVTVTNEIVFIENEAFGKDKTITVQLQQGSFTDVKKNVFAGLTNWTFNNVVREIIAPTLTAKAGSRSVTLSWNSVFGESQDMVYEIYMFSANAPQRLVGSTSQTTFRVEGLENGITYFFRIKAINTSNQSESRLSEAVSARPSVVLGTEDDLEAIDFQVYPNPSSDKLTLVAKFKTTAQWQVTIFDLMGKKVYEQDLGKISVLNSEINLSAWASGMYLLKLTNDNQVISKKIVKE